MPKDRNIVCARGGYNHKNTLAEYSSRQAPKLLTSITVITYHLTSV